MPLDRSLLTDYFTKERRHFFYNESKARAEAFAPHADGTYPGELIEARRPNEPLEVKAYRKEIWKPKTKPTFGRIISSLGKIRRSNDWSIKYPVEPFSLIANGETLYEYCEVNFPYYESVTNWVFGELLKLQLTDPNALCLVMPLQREVKENGYKKPYPLLFGSVDVVEYVEDDYAIINNPTGSTYYTDRGKTVNTGKSFYYADTTVIERWDQVNSKGDIQLQWSYAHGLGETPFFKLFGVSVKSNETARLNASRIEDILPELDEAVREYSDLQAGKVLNMYPERWEFTSAECPACNHTGFRPNPNWVEGQPERLVCDFPGCHGGYIANGPYSKIKVTPVDTTLGQQNSPIPPAGYIEKDIAILEIMERSVQKHIFDGLSAINFQFLEQSPQAQSGVAKEVDKDELNNTVHAIAEDLVRVMDKVYALIAVYRYYTLYPKTVLEMLPTIAVPERFDILSVNYLSEELDKAKKSGLNPAILNALEEEYASKKFNSDHEVADLLKLILTLDPLSNITEDDKISRLSNKGITPKSYVISSNIQAFVQRALEEDDKFAVQPLPAQIKKMDEYAQELIDGLDTAKQIIGAVEDVEEEIVDPTMELEPDAV